MKGTPQDYSNALRVQQQMLLQAHAFEAKSNDQPKRDEYCRLLLLRSSDLIGSVSHFVRSTDITAGQILMRSMLEDLIRILWATQSEANAEHLISHGFDEFKLAFRANLQGGTARVVDGDGNDHSQRYWESGALDRSVKRKSTESMASEAGAMGIYNMFYRFTSLHTHGNLLDLPRTDDPADISALLSGVGAISKSTGHTGIRWLLGRERPTDKELLEILGVH